MRSVQQQSATQDRRSKAFNSPSSMPQVGIAASARRSAALSTRVRQPNAPGVQQTSGSTKESARIESPVSAPVRQPAGGWCAQHHQRQAVAQQRNAGVPYGAAADAQKAPVGIQGWRWALNFAGRRR